MFVAFASAASVASTSAPAAHSARPSRVAPRVRGVGLPRADARRARLLVRRRASDVDPDADSSAGVPEDPQAAVEAMVDVDAIKAMISADPAVRAQEAKIASSARDAASLQVDAQMAEEASKIAREFGGKQGEITGALGAAQEAALANLEAKSAAVLAAEAKMEAIAAERASLVAEAESRSPPSVPPNGAPPSPRTSTRTPSGWRAPKPARSPPPREPSSPFRSSSRNPPRRSSPRNPSRARSSRASSSASPIATPFATISGTSN